MPNILVISGHPNLQKSYTNTVVLDQLSTSLDNLEIRKLDELYADYQIDVEAEQAALLKADVVVLQFPFYWYSTPALLKKWVDDVFSYNFAYGPQGDKLKGKDLFLSFTVGGPEESYNPLGYNHFTIEQMLRPLEQTAYLAGLKYHPPIYTHRMVYIPGVYNSQDAVESRARGHANRLVEAIRQLTESDQAYIEAFIATWFAQFDLLPEQSAFFTDHLSKDIRLTMPEGVFNGHEGFRDWYAMARSTFKPGCDHQVEQIEISSQGDTYQVQLRIRLLADTFDNSPLNGQSVNVLVNETWDLAINSDGHISILDYLVAPVNID